MSSVLVTGGCGYLGSNVCSFLANQNKYNITVVDSLIQNRYEGISYYELDLRNVNELKRLFAHEKFDVVLHFAGVIEPIISETDPFLFYETNLNSTINLIRLCLNFDVFKFIYSSSAAVYGNSYLRSVREDDVTIPINEYGKIKLLVEGFIDRISKKYQQFKYIIFRHFMVNGVGKYCKVQPSHKNPIDITIDSINKLHTFKIFGNNYDTHDGTCVRDYMHIDDVSTLYLKAMKNINSRNNLIFNASSNMPVSLFDIVNAVEKASEKKLEYIVTKGKENENTYQVGNNERAKKIFGWSPKSSDLNSIIVSLLQKDRKFS